MDELKKWIEEELPIEGEWWSDGSVEFHTAAETMNNAGMKLEDIKEILQALYSAVATEYS